MDAGRQFLAIYKQVKAVANSAVRTGMHGITDVMLTSKEVFLVASTVTGK